jgi:hypothetical protein
LANIRYAPLDRPLKDMIATHANLGSYVDCLRNDPRAAIEGNDPGSRSGTSFGHSRIKSAPSANVGLAQGAYLASREIIESASADYYVDYSAAAVCTPRK